jgi:RNA polymerase sigma-70 factor, ECF subfamily
MQHDKLHFRLPYQETVGPDRAFFVQDRFDLEIGDTGGSNGVSDADGRPDTPEQFLRLFLESERRIYAFILSVLANPTDADDVLQEVSLVLWKKFDQFQQGTDFVAWACRIAQFEVLKFYNKQRRSRIQFDQDGLEALANEVTLMGPYIEAQHAALAQCLERLATRDRDLLKRRYVNEATPKEIATQVGRSVDVIYKALTRIRDGLLNCIRRKLGEE